MKKIFLIIGIAGMMILETPVQAQALENQLADNISTVSETESIVPYADWLITNYSLYCSSAKKAVEITGKTSASSSMSKVGFKDIIIERSSDKINWTEEVDVGDKLTTSASTYSLADYSVSVKGGYYYRVRCKHYAKAKGLFGGSQSVENYTDGVWVD